MVRKGRGALTTGLQLPYVLKEDDSVDLAGLQESAL